MKFDVVSVWKNVAYRDNLVSDAKAVEAIALSDEDLAAVVGAGHGKNKKKKPCRHHHHHHHHYFKYYNRYDQQRQGNQYDSPWQGNGNSYSGQHSSWGH